MNGYWFLTIAAICICIHSCLEAYLTFRLSVEEMYHQKGINGLLDEDGNKDD